MTLRDSKLAIFRGNVFLKLDTIVGMTGESQLETGIKVYRTRVRVQYPEYNFRLQRGEDHVESV